MASDKKHLYWNLSELEHSRGFEWENFAYKPQLKAIQNRLLEYSRIAKALRQKNHQHALSEHAYNSIMISGQRGSGKTTFIKTLTNPPFSGEDSVTSNTNKEIIFLKTIDPSMIDQTDMFIMNVFVSLLEVTEPGNTRNALSGSMLSTQDAFEESKRSFALKLRAFLGVDRFHHLQGYDEELLLKDMTMQSRKEGLSLSRSFSSVLYYAANLLNVNIFVLPIDDMETDLERTVEVFEAIRKYLISPFLVPVVTCDPDLLSTGLKNSYAKNLKYNIELGIEKRLTRDQVVELAEHNIDKVLSPPNRFALEPLKQHIFDHNDLNQEIQISQTGKKGTYLAAKTFYCEFISKLTDINDDIIQSGINSGGFIKDFQSLIPNHNRGLIYFLKEIFNVNEQSRNDSQSFDKLIVAAFSKFLSTSKSTRNSANHRKDLSSLELSYIFSNNSEQKTLNLFINPNIGEDTILYSEAKLSLVLKTLYQSVYRKRPEKILDHLLILSHLKPQLIKKRSLNIDAPREISFDQGATTRNFINSLLTHSELLDSSQYAENLLTEHISNYDHRTDFECYGTFQDAKKSTLLASFESHLGWISDLMKVPFIHSQAKEETGDHIRKVVLKNLLLKSGEDARTIFNSDVGYIRFCEPKVRYQSQLSYMLLMNHLAQEISSWSERWQRHRQSLSKIFIPKFTETVSSYLNHFNALGREKVLERVNINAGVLASVKPFSLSLWGVDDVYEFCFLIENLVNKIPSEEVALSTLQSRYPDMYSELLEDEHHVEGYTQTLSGMIGSTSQAKYRVNELILRGVFSRFTWEREILHNVFNKNKLIYDVREVINSPINSASIHSFYKELSFNCFDFTTFFIQLRNLGAHEANVSHLDIHEALSWFFTKEPQKENIFDAAFMFWEKTDFQGLMDLIRLNLDLQATSVLNKIGTSINGQKANEIWEQEKLRRDQRLNSLKNIFTEETFLELQKRLPREEIEESPFWRGTFFQRCTRYLIASMYLREVAIIDPQSAAHDLDNPPDFKQDIVSWAQFRRLGKTGAAEDAQVMPDTIEIPENHRATITEFFYTFPMIRMHIDDDYRADLEQRVEAELQSEPEPDAS